MAVSALFLLAITAAAPLGQQAQPLAQPATATTVEPQLQVRRTTFALPVVAYQTPAGTWKSGKGILVARDLAPNATLGIGFYRLKPKNLESGTTVPLAGKSKKVAVGLSLRF